jgi:hypothetical protein
MVLRETCRQARRAAYTPRRRLRRGRSARQKMDSRIVTRLLGHSNARMLQRAYFRGDTEAVIEAMRKATGK